MALLQYPSVPEFNLKICNNFEGQMPIKSIDFSSDGEYLAASYQDFINIIDTVSGQSKIKISTEDTGAANLNYSFGSNKLIYSTTKKHSSIYVLDVEANKKLVNFAVPLDMVDSLTTIPHKHLLVCSTQDRHMRLWDVRAERPIGDLKMRGRGIVKTNPKQLLLYEVVPCGIFARNFGIFGHSCVASFVPHKQEHLSSVQCSPNGERVAVCNGDLVRIFDSQSLEQLRVIKGFSNNPQINIDITFNENGRILYTGGTDGVIHMWDVHSGERVWALKEDDSIEPVQIVCQNPYYMALGSAAGNKLSLWRLDADYIDAIMHDMAPMHEYP